MSSFLPPEAHCKEMMTENIAFYQSNGDRKMKDGKQLSGTKTGAPQLINNFNIQRTYTTGMRSEN